MGRNPQFEVDGVPAKAIATHKWREEIVRDVAPFKVEAGDYLQGFRPPLMCLGAGMIARRKSLASQGVTERDDCIRMAANTYCLNRPSCESNQKLTVRSTSS